MAPHEFAAPAIVYAQTYTLADFGTLPTGTASSGSGVNDSGQVTGYVTEGDTNRAFLSGPNGGALTALGTFGGNCNRGAGINDSGQVVGEAFSSDSDGQAFLFSNGSMQDLNSLIAPGSGFTLTTALGISNTGYITGDDFNNVTRQEDAFLLIPNTPAAVRGALTTVSFGLLLALGLSGLGVAAKKKGAASV